MTSGGLSGLGGEISAAPHPRLRPLLGLGEEATLAALVVGALIVGLGVMPCVYGLVAFRGHWDKMFRPPVPGHVVLNVVANIVVMWSAIALKGRFDRKLAGVFTRTLVVHGALAFLILVCRQWYSIPMLLTGVVASSLLGAAFAFARQQNVRLKIGVIGPSHDRLRDPALDCALIDDPDAAVGRFELIVITHPGELPPIWTPTLARALLAGKRIRHVSEFLEEVRGSVDIEHFDVDHLPEGGLTSYRTRKRLLDLVCVFVLLPVAIPVVAFASLGILLTMGSPVLFIQPRVGLGGKVFRMFKLRTMRLATPGEASTATGVRDSRVTPWGRWLRRLRIDEIPQMWNVVIGDMSFIGPRPEWTALAEGFGREESAYNYRHLVRPGITGWAQVRVGPAANLAETRVKLGYDLFYIKQFSFSLDLQILIRTVWTLIAGGGAR